MAKHARSILRMLALGIATTIATASAGGTERLCSIAPITYARAKTNYPDAAFALTELESRGIATWYSDREANGDYVETAKQLVTQCDTNTRLTVVVYGLPNKDCEAGYSSQGSRVKTASDYAQFISTLASIIGQRKVLYVLEPDAVGLLAKGDHGCAVQSGYKSNLQTAVRLLSANINAEIYMDVGYWTLAYPTQTAKVASIIRELGYAGRVKGITLNTSNYRSNSELSRLCSNFQQAIGNYNMRCIIDTSRNHYGASSNEWCNLRTAGIGHPPTGNTGLPNIDYFVWIKPPGDSDGTCSDAGAHTADAMLGPAAGEFFYDAFTSLWAKGYLVQQEKMPRVGEYAVTVPPPPPTTTPTPTTPTPTTPTPTTPTPTTPTPTTPEPTWATAAPTNSTSTSGSSSSAGSIGSSSDDELWAELLAEAAQRQRDQEQQQQQQRQEQHQSKDTLTPESSGIRDPETDSESTASSSSSSRVLNDGPIALLMIAGVGIATLGVVLVLRSVRNRKTLAVESKSPRPSYVSMNV